VTANGSVTMTWADKEYQFNVAKLAQAMELEDLCGCGLMEVFQRVKENRWRVSDVRETIRLGLIGGGLPPARALVLVRRYVEDRPWAESAPVALVVLGAAIVGVTGDNQNATVDRAEGELSSSEMTAGSAGPRSMN
jgi:hypothetical protein